MALKMKSSLDLVFSQHIYFFIIVFDLYFIINLLYYNKKNIKELTTFNMLTQLRKKKNNTKLWFWFIFGQFLEPHLYVIKVLDVKDV